jgi:uncharacterized repeat protein (TIGR03803 family)
MKSARRGLRFGDWVGGWFAPARRAKGTRQAGPLGRHRLLIKPLEQRRLLSATITTLASFSVPDGANPYAGVIEDSSGNLFGTTEDGGAYNDGTVFEVAAGSGAVGASAVKYNGAITRTQGEEIKARVLSGSTWSALNDATFLAATATVMRMEGASVE